MRQNLEEYYQNKQFQAEKQKRDIVSTHINHNKYYTSYCEKFGHVRWTDCQLLIIQDQNCKYTLAYTRETEGFPVKSQSHPIIKQQIPLYLIKDLKTKKNQLILNLSEKAKDQEWNFRFFECDFMLTRWVQLLIYLRFETNPKCIDQYFKQSYQQALLEKQRYLKMSTAKHQNQTYQPRKQLSYQEIQKEGKEEFTHTKLSYLQSSIYAKQAQHKEVENLLAAQSKKLSQLESLSNQLKSEIKELAKQKEEQQKMLLSQAQLLQTQQQAPIPNEIQTQLQGQLLKAQQLAAIQHEEQTKLKEQIDKLQNHNHQLALELRQSKIQVTKLSQDKQNLEEIILKMKQQQQRKDKNAITHDKYNRLKQKLALKEDQFNKILQKLEKKQQEASLFKQTNENLQKQIQVLKEKQAEMTSLEQANNLQRQHQKQQVCLFKNQLLNKLAQKEQLSSKLQQSQQQLLNKLAQKEQQINKVIQSQKKFQQSLQQQRKIIQTQLHQISSLDKQNQSLKQQKEISNKELTYKYNSLQQKIKSQQKINEDMAKLITKHEQKQQQYKQNIKQLNGNIQTLQQQLILAESKIQEQKQQQVDILKEQVYQLSHALLFQGDILDNRIQETVFLKEILETIKQTKIAKTNKIYHSDPRNLTSFHQYIDNVPDIVVLAKTETGLLIGGYSESPLSSTTVANKKGLLFSLSRKEVYPLLKDKRSVTNDKFFLIVGNSQLRIKQNDWTLFSNFGIPSAFFDCKGKTVNDLLEQGKEREVKITGYEVHAVTFE